MYRAGCRLCLTWRQVKDPGRRGKQGWETSIAPVLPASYHRKFARVTKATRRQQVRYPDSGLHIRLLSRFGFDKLHFVEKHFSDALDSSVAGEQCEGTSVGQQFRQTPPSVACAPYVTDLSTSMLTNVKSCGLEKLVKKPTFLPQTSYSQR